MNIIKIEQFENGSHANQFNASVCPSGWAIIPNTLAIPTSFPFVDIEVDGNTVTAMSEREVPSVEPIEETPTIEERLADAESYIEQLESAICEMDTENTDRLEQLESAICELDMAEEETTE